MKRNGFVLDSPVMQRLRSATVAYSGIESLLLSIPLIMQSLSF